MFVRQRIRSLIGEIRNLTPIIALALLILLNLTRIRSPVVGTVASIAYIIITGYHIGKAFLVEEEEKFLRWLFGSFLVLCLFIFVGTPIVVLYQLDVLGLAVVLFAPLMLLLARTSLWPSSKDTATEAKNDTSSPRFSPIYVVYLSLIAYSLYLLLEARSGWIYGDVWSVVSPFFFVVYFSAVFLLIGIILYSNTQASSKVSMTILLTLVSSAVFALVLYPGNAGDPMDHMGFARLIYGYGEMRRGFPATAFHLYWLLKEKGLALLSGALSKMFYVDVYWVHTFILPVTWSLFIPLAAFKICRLLDWNDRVGIFAGLLASFHVGFAGWSSRTTGNSLGFVPFFISVCFSLWYMKTERRMLMLLAIFTALVSTLVHPLTGTMSFIFFILATGLRNYTSLRSKHRLVAYVLLLFVLVSGFLTILALFSLNTLIYRVLAPQYAEEAQTAFSFGTLLNTDAWALVFGEYVNFSFRDLLLNLFVPILGIVGLAYALKRAEGHRSKLLVWPMLVAFILCLAMYRILKYAMVDVLFGPGRLWTFRDFMAIPFAALVVVSVIEHFEGVRFRNPFRSVVVFRKWSVHVVGRYVLTWLFIGLVLSAFAAASVEKDYEWLRGMQPTALEVEAVRYIDENTDGRYVVFTMPQTTQIGWGFVGTWNFMKYYHFSSELGKLPSVADMTEYMETYQAGVGYFVASFRTPDLEKTVDEASRMYGLFKVLGNENGKIYIFNYEIPPLPLGYPNPDANVNAFYWSTPSALFVQNGLFRVLIGNSSLDLRDFWGDLYESVDFTQTSVGGNPLGNLTSIDRLDPSLGSWVEWNLSDSIAPSSQFQFRINFENDSLIGAVERSRPYIELSWESGRESILSLSTGDFDRLYLPGLVGGVDSYNVSSREFGLLYTASQTPNVAIRPAFKFEEAADSTLVFQDIENYGNLTITTGYLSYELYIHNLDTVDQWVNIEVWVPDVIYGGTFPPFECSVDDGRSWSGSLTYTDFPRGIPIRTYGGTEVNWYFSRPADSMESPTVFRAFSSAEGGPPMPPESFTLSGGGQKRMLYGLYLPARDRVLLRIGFSVYYSRPLKITYFFTDSDNPYYGMLNFEGGATKLYNLASASQVGGWSFTQRPSSIGIIEDETGEIGYAIIALPADTDFRLYAKNEIDTTIDANGDGIPDRI